ncbi:GPI transamidase component GPI16 [Nakaseomyces bracarensis]|uniref:GPI transamidase component GPI16 n=1 Tax=Nakaseomyces bracarensis TaxID=273131 RepID=A0ABR4NRK3_9SACH
MRLITALVALLSVHALEVEIVSGESVSVESYTAPENTIVQEPVQGSVQEHLQEGVQESGQESVQKHLQESDQVQVDLDQTQGNVPPNDVEENSAEAIVELSKKYIQKKKTHGGQVRYPFHEELNLQPLPKNYLRSSFQFGLESEPFDPSKSMKDYDEYSHYTVFPRAIDPLLRTSGARQFHLRFTRGYWDSEVWGKLPFDGFKSGGSGVELWAVIEAQDSKAAYQQWKSLANSLSGLFCASINFIESSKTVFPVAPEQFSMGAGNEQKMVPVFDSENELFLLHASLPNEPICTENLTPLIKLLPTKGKSGLSSLLDSHKIFDSDWHSMSIDVDTVCDDINNICKFEMEAIVDMVTNVPKSLKRDTYPIPKPVQASELRCDLSKPHDDFMCFPLPEETEVSYDLSKIFGRKIVGSNQLSYDPSRICATVTDKWNAFINVNGSLMATDNNCFELHDQLEYDVYFETDDSNNVFTTGDVPIFASRSLTGYGQDHGGLRTVFRNPTDKEIKLIYFETLPWFMRVYLSTLQLDSKNSSLSLDDVIESSHYEPAKDREKPTHLEFNIIVPPKTSFALSYQFDKAILQTSEYPPDANHGFEVQAAIITVVQPVHYQLRTSTLLLYLSTPDFSMPYNVNIITSTIMGLIFGMLYNMMVKKLLPLEEADKIMAKRNIKTRLKNLKLKLLAKLNGAKKSE